ncbi:MAG TPA: M20/M25/M40 family metallo-hydrolase, partial [Rubellimicrobium sp.]|nr:M20/M25/M40 family metallo-hydrolase [Rubellimicrobium sp.]
MALRLTERPSITGSSDEASFGPWLAEMLAADGRFGPSAEVWTFPVAEGDPRLCVALLVRRSDAATVLLTGHHDTVTTSDYGDLQEVALRPDELLAQLRARLEEAAAGTAEGRAREDFASGRFVPGRGLLDMKAGLAAGLSVVAAFSVDPQAQGNLLFIAVPDEENASAGARCAAGELGSISRERGLEIRAAVNLDAIADDGDGAAGRVVALGTVGKVLPTAFVVGAPVHSGFPLRGLNAAVLAGALAQRFEWAPELTDESATEPGTPIS